MEFGRAYCDDTFNVSCVLGKELVPIMMDETIGHQMLEEIKSAVSFIRILWFYNVGDEAILQSIIESLHKENPNIELVVLSNDPDYTRKMYGVEAVNRWSIKSVYNAIKNSDGLISGGGVSSKIKRV